VSWRQRHRNRVGLSHAGQEIGQLSYNPRLMPKHSSQIFDLARRGAEHRYAELKAEMTALVKTFPHLAAQAGHRLSAAAHNARAAAEAEAPKMRRRAKRMSVAARKAVSVRMKKYWATRRKAKA
jgi:hypothetical protein